MTYYLNYEGKKKDFSIPEEWKVIANVDISSGNPVRDARAEVERALDNPIESVTIEQLAKTGMDVIILFDDAQRATPAHIAIPSILNRLNQAGIPDERISAVCAVGTHPKNTLEQMEAKIGEEGSRRLRGRIVCHDPYSAENIIIGKTHRGTLVEVNKRVASADLVIGIGQCMPHPDIGFGGGCKIVMPGVSSYRAIADHHFSWMRQKIAKLSALDGNQWYQETVDAALLSGLTFKLDFVLNEKKQVVRAFAGHPVAEHREASECAASLHRVSLPHYADVTITSASPLEIGVQSAKALMMAGRCTNSGGTIIWVAPQKNAGSILPLIKEMASPETATEFHRKLITGDIPEHLRSFGISYIMQVVIFKELSEKFNVIHVTEGLSPEQVAMMNFSYAETVGEAIDRTFRKIPKADIAIFPSGGNILPDLGVVC